MIIELVVGDWSKDGHNQSDKFLYETNLSKEEIEKAFSDGCNTIGIKFNICEEYEDDKVSQDFISKIVLAGLDPSKYLYESWDSKKLERIENPESFSLLWLDIAKVGNSSLEYKLIKPESGYGIKIGGYGLYY